MARLVIFGCGYSGLALARVWKGEIYGSTRSRSEILQASNINPFSLEDKEQTRAMIELADAIVISTPPPDPLLEFSQFIQESRAWTGYLSTTAVFGDHQGNWVNETTPPCPTSKRGKLRLETERMWLERVPRVNIFRLAGIYGQGRGPLEKIRSARAQKIIKANQVFGRIHVDDIARILLGSFHAKDQSELYALSDDLPAPPEDVLDYAAQKLGVPPLTPVPFETAQMSDMARSFYEENKRIDNTKIKTRFGDLLYPDYRKGIDAICTQEEENQSLASGNFT